MLELRDVLDASLTVAVAKEAARRRDEAAYETLAAACGVHRRHLVVTHWPDQDVVVVRVAGVAVASIDRSTIAALPSTDAVVAEVAARAGRGWAAYTPEREPHIVPGQD